MFYVATLFVVSSSSSHFKNDAAKSVERNTILWSITFHENSKADHCYFIKHTEYDLYNE